MWDISNPTSSCFRICQTCWLAYRKYSAMTPGGMNKDFGPLTKFPAASKGKKATTLFLLPTPAAQVARKLPRSKVQSFYQHE